MTLRAFPGCLPHAPPWPRLARAARTAWLALLLVALPAAADPAGGVEDAPVRAALPWASARQLVVVVPPDRDSHQALLRRFERTGGAWHAVGAAVPVVIGRAGTAWGVGLHPPQPGLQKREGDGRSPAGVFALGTAFGYAPAADTALPYQAMTAGDWCIDVDGSPLYNRIVDDREVGPAAVAGSTEPMRRDLHADGDMRYRLGFVVEHNPAGTPHAGSCIFAHLWRSPDSTTAGCTAMAEPAMLTLLGWLKPEDSPAFVLLPAADYQRLQARWQLPVLDPAHAAGAAAHPARRG